MSDDWETPREAFKDALGGLPKRLVLYDPFYCAGRSQIYMEDMGFRVVKPITNCDRTSNGTCDCQNREDLPPFDLIVTNAPYSELEYAVTNLLTHKKPVFLLVPHKVTTREWFKDALRGHEYKLLPNEKRYQYISNGMQLNACPFDSTWVFIDAEHLPAKLKRTNAFAAWEEQVVPDKKNKI